MNREGRNYMAFIPGIVDSKNPYNDPVILEYFKYSGLSPEQVNINFTKEGYTEITRKIELDLDTFIAELAYFRKLYGNIPVRLEHESKGASLCEDNVSIYKRQSGQWVVRIGD